MSIKRRFLSYSSIVLILGLAASLVSPAIAATQIDILGPPGSGEFGRTVTALPNGNIVVIDPYYDDGAIADVGAAYLYDGASGEQISMLTGIKAGDWTDFYVTVLTNGNYLLISPLWDNGAVAYAGAVTWGDATTGITGTVSTTNSLVGSTAYDMVGLYVTALTNGNYLVSSPEWDNGVAVDAGAVTWGDGTTGITGTVNALNSLVGSTTDDQVGDEDQVTALTNGNYVVSSYHWDNGAVIDAGAATWGDGTTGITGAINATNSLVGSTAGDHLGGVTALTNGNYVVRSPAWDNGAVENAGAVTWGNGTTGITGTVSALNSLMGSTAWDQIANYGVTALTNGNYVVRSTYWDNGAVTGAGAVTWGDGTTGITGTVSATNSLVGSTANDQVGSYGVTALTNGNYVVSSTWWDNGAAIDAGAVTWGDGTTGITGTVSALNSLVGSTTYDGVGDVRALGNGNYVVSSLWWDNGAVIDAGAVTWGDGTSGITGAVSAVNSLVGSTADDRVGYVTALTNGNYVVASSTWDNGTAADAGAVTWGEGTTGITGTVSALNSLVGSTSNDQVGGWGVTALINGNYVVPSPAWDNGAEADAGAVTWGNGTTGITGAVSAANSLVVSTEGDMFGDNGVTALTNGNYVARSPYWNNGAVIDAGAVTWGNGDTGITGEVSPANSLVGSTVGDQVGSSRVTALINGNYVVKSSTWDNGAVVDAGAVTLGNGSPVSNGPITADNSVLGTTTGGGFDMNFAYDEIHQQLVVGRPFDNIVSLFYQNRTPLADAGPDQSVKSLSSVMLDGSASYDLDGDELTFEWVQSGGIPVTLSGSDTVNPSFTAPAVTETLILTFTLVVSDPLGLTSPPDEVVITVEPWYRILLPVVSNQEAP